MPNEYIPAGAAVTNTIQQILLERAARERQAMVDRIAAEDRERQRLAADKALARQEMEHEWKREDRERSKTEKEVEGMVIGDVPDAGLVARARKYGIPLRVAVAPPSAEVVEAPGLVTELGGSPSMPAPVAGPIRFAGSPAQVKEQEAKEAQRAFLEKLPAGSPEAQSAAARVAGLPMGASDFREPRSSTPAVGSLEDFIVSKYGNRPTPEQIAQGRKEYMEAGRRPATEGRSGALDNRVLTRVNRFDTSPVAKNFEDMVAHKERVADIDYNLAGAPGAAQDAMLIYTFAKAMDPASAVREGEYNTVQQWAQAVLPKYGFSLQRVLSPAQMLTAEARKAIKERIDKAYNAQRLQYNRGVERLQEDLKRIGETETWRDKIGPDEEPAQSRSGGIPEVGSMFQGGKVLKVTPIPSK